MSNLLFDTLFGVHAGRDKTFLALQGGRRVSYKDFLHQAAQYAHVISNAGLGPGDRLAAQVQKSPEALALYAACIQAGVVFLPLNTGYTTGELSYFIENSGARLVVCGSEDVLALSSVATHLGAVLETLDADGGGSLSRLAEGMPHDYPTVDREADDLAALLYTSGTTGRSKGAMLTHENLLSNALTLQHFWRFTSEDVLLHALPIFHTHGLFVATNITLAAGGSMIFLPSFDLDEIIEYLPTASVMMGVPTFYTRLLSDERFSRDLVTDMRLFISGSAPLLAETHSQFADRTGHQILERYGMTETNMNTSNPYDGERRPGTVGFPLPGVELRIMDAANGAPVKQGNVGQIEVRGPNVFKGYWEMPERTADELRPDGFFITGDLGKTDADGYLHIVGRNKDLIISGGYNIYPKEIELVLDEQPGVLESAVIGVPHSDFGETVLGLIVPEKGTTPNLEQIADAARASLARFKQPRKLVVVDELPRNTMGKVQKNLLRQSFKDEFNGAS